MSWKKWINEEQEWGKAGALHEGERPQARGAGPGLRGLALPGCGLQWSGSKTSAPLAHNGQFHVAGQGGHKHAIRAQVGVHGHSVPGVRRPRAGPGEPQVLPTCSASTRSRQPLLAGPQKAPEHTGLEGQGPEKACVAG